MLNQSVAAVSLLLLQIIQPHMSGFLIGEDVLVVGDVFDTTASEWTDWLKRRADSQAYTKQQPSLHLHPVPEQQEQDQNSLRQQQQGHENCMEALPTPFAAGPASPSGHHDSSIAGGCGPSVLLACISDGSKASKGSGVGAERASSSCSCAGSGVFSLAPSSSLNPKMSGGHRRVKKNRTSVQVESSNCGLRSQVSWEGV